MPITDSPSVIERVRATFAVPGYKRMVATRRLAAVILVLIAVVGALPGRAHDHPRVAVATKELEAGHVLEPHDVELRAVPEDFVPDNANDSVDELVGQVLAAPLSAGEVVTRNRVVGPDLVDALLGENTPEKKNRAHYSLVPVKLAEPDVIPMLHQGDVVSVVTVGTESSHGRVVAAHARVVMAGSALPAASGAQSPASAGQMSQSSILLLLPSAEATAVAAASLNSPLSVVMETSMP